jgi:hypothetical protein
MSATSQTKNIGKSTKIDHPTWLATLRMLIIDFNNSDNRNRISVIHQIFDFLASDLSWKKKDSKFVQTVFNKLAEFKKSVDVGPKEREYFRKIEEKIGIFRYCCANTIRGYQCSNTVCMGGKRNYCQTHYHRNNRISKKINKHSSIGPDMCNIISEYM